MDGIHDLGGMEGFGPVRTDAPPFDHDWERRMWALAKHAHQPGTTLDYWRHTIERMDPATYLALPYFEKWCLNHMTQYIQTGVFTLDEVLSGHTDRHDTPPAPSGLDGASARLKANEAFFDLDAPEPPRFKAGDTVTTRDHISANHTRLPRYARAKAGAIVAHRGAHVFPDASAEGREEGQHLYTVAFTATELWGDAADSRDSVTLDLWDSYLAPA